MAWKLALEKVPCKYQLLHLALSSAQTLFVSPSSKEAKALPGLLSGNPMELSSSFILSSKLQSTRHLCWHSEMSPGSFPFSHLILNNIGLLPPLSSNIQRESSGIVKDKQIYQVLESFGLLVLFGCSGVTPGSGLRHHSWWCFGGTYGMLGIQHGSAVFMACRLNAVRSLSSPK